MGEQNVRRQRSIRREASPVLSAQARPRRLMVVGGVFGFRTGRGNLLDTDASTA